MQKNNQRNSFSDMDRYDRPGSGSQRLRRVRNPRTDCDEAMIPTKLPRQSWRI